MKSMHPGMPYFFITIPGPYLYHHCRARVEAND